MSRVFVENIDQGAHTADLRCGKQGCDYSAEGVNLNTHAQVKFVENVEGLTINGNVLASVANVASLPDASGGSVDDIRHVVSDDAQDTIPAGGANLYRIVDDGGKQWVRINSGVVVTCPTCGIASSYPCFDPRNVCGADLGKAKTA